MAIEQSLISKGNSSVIPLGAGETFTGEWEQNNFPNVGISVKSDQDGTVFFDFSTDHGTNTDSTFPVEGFQVAANISEFHTAVKLPRWFRVRYVNGDVAQSYLRLATYYGTFLQGNIPINQSIGQDADAILVRTTDYKSEVAMEKRNGRNIVNKFGHNTDIDTASPEIVASFGGAFNPSTAVISTAQTFTITYNNATDGLGTTGALMLLITYLDANYLTQNAVHVLTATGSDVTAFTGFGINRVVVIANGGLPYNVNDIDLTATIDATVQARIPALGGVTQQALFHTQVGYNLLVEFIAINVLKLSGGSAPRVNIKLFSYSRVTLTRYDVYEINIDTSVQNDYEIILPIPLVFGGREVIYLEASTNTNSTEVIARFSGIETEVI